jgi:arabinan endo-1,5-alpha-L-arabinosidase
LLKGDENYYGVGHNSVYTFNNADYLFMHAYDKKDNGRPKLVTHQLEWDKEGWPSLKK